MGTIAGFDKNPQNINKKGKPAKSWTWAGLLKRFLEEEDATGVPAKVAICRKLIQKSKRGDNKAIDTIMDRTEGKPKQSIEVDDSRELIKDMKRYVNEKIQPVDSNIQSKPKGKAVSTK